MTHAARAIAAIAAGDDVDEAPRPAIRIDVPATTRARSVLLLAAGVLGAAALLGVLLSALLVGFSTLLN